MPPLARQRSRAKGKAGSVKFGEVSEAPKAPESNLSKFKARGMWDKKFGSKARIGFAAIGRLERRKIGKQHVATFRIPPGEEEVAEREELQRMREELGRGHPSVRELEKEFSTREARRSHTLRFPVEQSLVEIQQQVGAAFGMAESAVLFQRDHHEWEIPITAAAQLSNIFEAWELEAGPRTKSKYDALFAEVEAKLHSDTDTLQGACAAWELACRSTNLEMLGEGFVEALHSVLSCGAFAATCHAAAAVHTLMQIDETAARFPPRLAESLERAVRVAFNPTPASELREVCKGSASFLARMAVGALHRVLDDSYPNYKQHASLLAGARRRLAARASFFFCDRRASFFGAFLFSAASPPHRPPALARSQVPTPSSRSGACCSASRRAPPTTTPTTTSGPHAPPPRTSPLASLPCPPSRPRACARSEAPGAPRSRRASLR